VGLDRQLSRQFLVFAIAVLGLGFLVDAPVWASVGVFQFGGMEETGRVLFLGIGAIAVVGAAINGYANDGVLFGSVVALAPLLGVLVFRAVRSFLGLPAPDATVGGFVWLLGTFALAGVVCTLGGTALGRVLRTNSEPSGEPEPF
jgi:hypothetical protein